MTFYDYAYAPSGWDAPLVDFVNFETTFTIPALTTPLAIPRGFVTSKANSGHEVIDGWREVSLEQLGDPYGVTLFADLDTYVTAVHTSWDGEDAEISLKVHDVGGTYAYWNVIAHLPSLGQDFSFNPMDSRYASDLKLRYTLVNTYTPA